MKITKITEGAIHFNNGNSITFSHDQDCCEDNYADFSVLTNGTVNIDYDFNENLIFKKVDGGGFLFGNEGHMIFVPCYSEQNGYYTSNIDIYYNGQSVISLDCEMIYRD